MSTSRRKSISLPPWVSSSGSCVAAPMMMLLTALMAMMMLPAGSLVHSLDLQSSNCILQEPLYNVTFNMTSLNSDLARHVTSDKNEKFIFDVCDVLDKRCNNIPNTVACLHRKDGMEIILGTKTTLHLEDGRLHFNFTNGQRCTGEKNYSLVIILMCSYATEPDPVSVIPYSDDQCNYFMFWRTIHACLPLPERLKNNECSVKDSTGHVFNLLPLSHDNQRVLDRNGSHFTLTACKPVHYSHMGMCPPGSSVCFVNETETDYTKKFLDYGQTDANPAIVDGKIVMTMNSSSEKCQNSKITFECDTTVEGDVQEYIGKEGCTHLFSWRTPLACKKSEFCAVVDPITGFKFNMTSLAGKKYSITRENTTYEFAICKAPAKASDFQCSERVGACQSTQGNSQVDSLGNINDVLFYNITGAPFLRYISGAICKQPNERWQTKIEFICETDKGQKAPPKIVENSGCELLIQLETELACAREISCSAMNLTNDLEVDLRPLSSANYNYEAEINSSLALGANKTVKFYLNVCRPLLPLYGLGCPGGSAACLAVQGPNDSTPTNELSLGYPDVSLILVRERAHLKYLRGSVCPQDNNTSLSTAIEFYCQPKAGRGVPILQEILHDCQYRFEWATNVMCAPYGCEFRPKSCEISNGEMGANVDLRNVFSNGELVVSPSTTSASAEIKDGKIQLCSKNLSVIANYKDQTAAVTFTIVDASCKETGGFVNVNLQITCGTTTQLVVTEQTSCHLLLTQVTPQICPFVGIPVAPGPTDPTGGTTSSTPTPADNHTNSSTTQSPAPTAPSTAPTAAPTSAPTAATSTSAVPGKTSTPTSDHSSETNEEGSGSTVGIILAILTLLSLMGAAGFLVLRNPDRREYLRSLLQRRNVLVQYSRVRTTEEASLLMNPSGPLSDSDDEMLI